MLSVLSFLPVKIFNTILLLNDIIKMVESFMMCRARYVCVVFCVPPYLVVQFTVNVLIPVYPNRSLVVE